MKSTIYIRTNPTAQKEHGQRMWVSRKRNKCHLNGTKLAKSDIYSINLMKIENKD